MDQKTAEFKDVVRGSVNFDSAEIKAGLSTVPEGTTVTCHRIGPDITPPSQLARLWACLKAIPNCHVGYHHLHDNHRHYYHFPMFAYIFGLNDCRVHLPRLDK